MSNKYNFIETKSRLVGTGARDGHGGGNEDGL